MYILSSLSLYSPEMMVFTKIGTKIDVTSCRLLQTEEG